MFRHTLITAHCFMILSLLAIILNFVSLNIFFKGIYSSKTILNCESSTFDAPKDTVAPPPTSKSSTFLPQYVLHMGIEGTGHHFIHDLIDNSPLLKMETYGMIKHRKDTCIVFKRLYLDMCKDETSGQNADRIFTQLVEKLREMDHIVRTNEPWLRYGEISEGNINFNINSLDKNGCHLSLPMGENRTCRNLQFHGIDSFHKACSEANITCGHVVMFRDSYEVLKSTMRRNFDERKELVSTFTVKLQTLASEMMMHRDRLIGCFDYNNVSNIMIDRGQNNMFGWNVRDGSLERAIEKYYKPKNSTSNVSHYGEIFSPKFQLYMKPMIDSNNKIKQMCMEFLELEV